METLNILYMTLAKYLKLQLISGCKIITSLSNRKVKLVCNLVINTYAPLSFSAMFLCFNCNQAFPSGFSNVPVLCVSTGKKKL